MAGREIVVYCTIYGSYDIPKHTVECRGVKEWRLYTDNPAIVAPGWNVVVESPPVPDGTHPRMLAKWRKCVPPEDFEDSLYIDGSVVLHTSELVDSVVSIDSEWCMYPHPARDCILDEAHASTHNKYAGLPVLDQAHSYIQNGHGTHSGLWACGIIGRKHTGRVVDAGKEWYSECCKWTYQDQISLPVVLKKYGVLPSRLTVGGGLWGNACFSLHAHQGGDV